MEPDQGVDEMIQRSTAFEQWSPQKGDKLLQYGHENECFSEIRLRRTDNEVMGYMFIGVYRDDGRMIMEQILDISGETDKDATILGMDEARRWAKSPIK
jgi:hypothetical protein